MAKQKYPLDPLAKLRGTQVDAATKDLAARVGERERAARAREAAEVRRREEERAASQVREGVQDSLAHGELSAGDLQRAQAWEVGAGVRAAQLTGRVASAAEQEAAAREQEQAAKTALAARKADADVVDKDKARFVNRLRKEAEAREEEASAEAWRDRRG